MAAKAGHQLAATVVPLPQETAAQLMAEVPVMAATAAAQAQAAQVVLHLVPMVEPLVLQVPMAAPQALQLAVLQLAVLQHRTAELAVLAEL
jgi:hypothetical protein